MMICPVLLAPSPAAAHVIIDGVSGFASLVLHPLVTVDTVLVMVAAALVVGATERARLVMVCLFPALAGGMAGSFLQVQALEWPGLWRLPLAVALLLGVLAMTGWRIGSGVGVGTVVVAALTMGLGLIPESIGVAGRAETGAAAGTAIILALVVISVPRAAMQHPVVQIAGRVIGAWIVAIAALGLTASLR